MFFHLGGTVALERYFGVKYFDTVFQFGDAGVSFFFVLSGFVITLAHRNEFGKPKALLQYARRRAVRIYPGYLLVAGAVYLIAQAVPAISAGMPRDAGALIKELLLIPRDPKITGGTGSTILLVAWSLQYELFFYLLTGLLLLSPALWTIAVVALLALQLAVLIGIPGTFPISFFANESILLFWFGMAVAAIVKSDLKVKSPWTLVYLGIASFTAIAIGEALISKAPHRELAYGLASCVIIVGFARAEDRAEKRWKLPTLALLGEASYALYLIHFPVISIVAKTARGAGLTGQVGAIVVFVGSSVLCVALALAFHRWIERPIIRKLSARPRTGADQRGATALASDGAR